MKDLFLKLQPLLSGKIIKVIACASLVISLCAASFFYFPKKYIYLIFIILATIGIFFLFLSKEKFKKYFSKKEVIKDNNVISKGEIIKKIELTYKNYKHTLDQLSVIKRRKLKKLPWVLVFGDKETGKSTLIRRSGLDFPFYTFDQVNAIGEYPTKYSDIIQSGKLNILDISGEGFHENSGILSEPINFLNNQGIQLSSIVMVLSVEDLINQVSMEKLSCDLKNNLERIYNLCKRRIPVVIVINKIDCLPGFQEFSSIKEVDIKLPFGFDVSNNDNLILDIQKSLQKLKSQVYGINFKQVNKFNHLDNKKNIYNFSRTFSFMIQQLTEVISMTFKDPEYCQDKFVSGIYFCAAGKTNKNNSLQSNEKYAMNLSAFTYQLFDEVILPGALLTKYVVTQFYNSWNKHRIKKIFGLFGIVVLISLMVNSYLFNHAITKDFINGIDNLTHDELSFDNASQKYLVIIQLYQMHGVYKNRYQHASWWQKVFFSKENKLDAYFMKHYVDFVSKYNNVSFIQHLENNLVNLSKKWSRNDSIRDERERNQYYLALKSYLQFALPHRMEGDFIKKMLYDFCQYSIFKKEDINHIKFKDLRPAIDYFIDSYSIIKKDDKNYYPFSSKLIYKARKDLFITHDNYIGQYQLLKNSIYSKIDPLSIEQLMPGNYEIYFESQVPLESLYTPKGWRNLFQPALDKLFLSEGTIDWVFSEEIDDLSNINYSEIKPINLNDLKKELSSIYFQEYYTHWLKFIGGLKFKPFRDVSDASLKIGKLADKVSPLYELFEIIENNMKIIDKNGLVYEAANGPLYETFTFSHEMSNREEGSFLNIYRSKLLEIQNELDQLWISADRSQALQSYATQILSTNRDNNTTLKASLIDIEKLIRTIENQDLQRHFHSLFVSIIKETWRAVVSDLMQDINDDWQSKVLTYYKSNINGKFPFANTNIEVSLYDLKDFLHPQEGILINFYNQNISPFVKLENQRLIVKQWTGIGPDFSDKFLKYIKEMNNLSKAFFTYDTTQPTMQIEFYPIPSREIRKITLKTDGFSLKYQNEPQEWSSIKWPNHKHTQYTSLSLDVVEEKQPHSISTTGIWSLFRLLKKAEIRLINRGKELSVRWHFANDEKTFIAEYQVKINGFEQSLMNLLNGNLVAPENI